MRSIFTKKKIEYPDDPGAHIVTVRHKNNGCKIDENYDFINERLYYRFLSALLRGVAWMLLPLITKLSTGYSIKGRGNLRKVKRRGVIIISNHVSYMDACVICACAFRFRKVRFVTLSSNMDIPFAGKLIKSLGGVPLANGGIGAAKKFSGVISNLLRRGKPVLFFAEQSLWPDYEGIRPFHKGGFVFASKEQVPVLPMVFTFKKGLLRKRLILNIGEPIFPEEKSSVALCEETHRYFVDFTEKFYNEA